MSSMVYVMTAVVAAVCVSDVGAQLPRPCIGCYEPMDVNHPKVSELATFYLEKKGNHMMLDEVLSAKKQLVAGMNYELILRFHELILCGNPVTYLCTVTIYEDLKSQRSISNQRCTIEQVPKMAFEC